MRRTLLSGWHVVLHAALVPGLLLTTACTKVFIVYPNPGFQTVMLPQGCPPNVHPNDPNELQACLGGLEFDTTETLGDQQRLMVIDNGGPTCLGFPGHTCRHGPLAKIEPVKGSHTYPDSALDKGRIIARMYLAMGETESYPKFGLVPGDTTYWWVNTAKDSSYFVRDSSGSIAAVPRTLTRNAHEPGSFMQGVARWIWEEDDEKLNGTCGSACCK
jgi:hypothetical protein